MKDKTNYESFKSPELFKEYMLLKTDPLEFLFQDMGKLFIIAEKNGKVLEFDVQVKHPSDTKNPWDCKVGNFELNRYFRTDKGHNGEKYKSLALMLQAIEKGMKQEEISATPMAYRIVLDTDRIKRLRDKA